jgi:hypothetical protein
MNYGSWRSATLRQLINAASARTSCALRSWINLVDGTQQPLASTIVREVLSDLGVK